MRIKLFQKSLRNRFFLLLIFIMLPMLYFNFLYHKHIHFSPSDFEDSNIRVALVLGAGLKRPNEPSTVLADRVVSAVNLLKEKKVEKLLLSGKKIPYYDEVKAMKTYALKLGANESQLLFDEQGYRTLDSCRNAKENFKLKELIVVTQKFHLPRSLYLCEKFGIQAKGFVADISRYPFYSKLKWNIRETFASWKAIWDILWI